MNRLVGVALLGVVATMANANNTSSGAFANNNSSVGVGSTTANPNNTSSGANDNNRSSEVQGYTSTNQPQRPIESLFASDEGNTLSPVNATMSKNRQELEEWMQCVREGRGNCRPTTSTTSSAQEASGAHRGAANVAVGAAALGLLVQGQ